MVEILSTESQGKPSSWVLLSPAWLREKGVKLLPLPSKFNPFCFLQTQQFFFLFILLHAVKCFRIIIWIS